MQEYLLDTHVLLWCLMNPAALEIQVRNRIADGANRVVVSTASIWEAAIKAGLGKLDIPDDFVGAIRDASFEDLPISSEHAVRAGGLPRHYGDPFDRMLIAQAQHERLTLVTADAKLDAYDVKVLRAG